MKNAGTMRRWALAVVTLVAVALAASPSITFAGNCVGGSNNSAVCSAASTCPGGFCDSVATPTATPTATATPTVSATSTPKPKTPPAPRGVPEASTMPNARGASSPQWITVIDEAGSLTTTADIWGIITRVEFHVRGVSLYCKTGTGTFTLKIGGVTVLSAEPIIGGSKSYAVIPESTSRVRAGVAIAADVVSSSLASCSVQLDATP